MNEVTVIIPPSLWLSSNRTVRNVGYKSRMVRAIQDLMKSAAEEQWLMPVTGQVQATWSIAYPKGTGWTHGDPTNAHPTTKACLDALVPRWIIGDGPRVVISETFRRAPNLLVPRDHAVTLRLEAGEAS